MIKDRTKLNTLIINEDCAWDSHLIEDGGRIYLFERVNCLEDWEDRLIEDAGELISVKGFLYSCRLYPQTDDTNQVKEYL